MVKIDENYLERENIISCMKSFNKRTCKLCMKERMAMLEMVENNPKQLIDSRPEICVRRLQERA